MKNKIFIIWIILILFIIFPNIALATNIKIGMENNQINAGEEVVLHVTINDIDIPGGINSVQGKIEYNAEDWEHISEEDINGKNNWSIAYNQEGNYEGNFVLIKLNSGETKEQELFEIRLKAKNKLVNSNSKIKLINLYTTDGEKMVSIEDTVQEVSIKSNYNIIAIIIAVVAVIALIVAFVLLGKKVKTNER